MQIKLSDHFTYGRLFRFVLPSIMMMVFISIYGVVDGLFVSNFVGKTQFAAINLIMPVLMILGALGFMVGTGGSAIVAKTLGEGEPEKANRYFSMLVYVVIGGGLAISMLGFVFMPSISRFLGASGDLLESCVLYGRIMMASLTGFMLQNVFQAFLITAEKPRMGLLITVAAGCTNIVLDFLFIVVFHWGLAGAAIATAMSELVAGLVPLGYFLRENTSLLRLGRTRFMGAILLKTCINGSSELMTHISMSIVTVLYNFQLMRLAGENGIAAYGVIMYVHFIFASIYLGYGVGCAPIFGFHYGAKNKCELQNMFKKSFRIIAVVGLLLAITAISFAGPLAKLFVGYDQELWQMTSHGLRVFSIAFLFSGFNTFGSALFTALSNGVVSAIISFVRVMIFEVSAIIFLPILFGLNGIWCSIIVAEVLALGVTGSFIAAKRKRYGYL